jgi:hypothetical protein
MLQNTTKIIHWLHETCKKCQLAREVNSSKLGRRPTVVSLHKSVQTESLHSVFCNVIWNGSEGAEEIEYVFLQTAWHERAYHQLSTLHSRWRR